MKLDFKKDFYGTLVAGYGLIFLNILSQVILIPLYIQGLGLQGYGVFLLLYSFMHYVDIGVGLFSGGVLRLLGEKYAEGDREGLGNCYTISKLVICSYGVIAAFLMLGYGLWAKGLLYFNEDGEEAFRILFSAMAFLFAKYDLSVEYQALVGTQRQTFSNCLQILAQIVYLSMAVPYLWQGEGKASSLFLFQLAGLFLVRVIVFVYHKSKRDGIRIVKFNSGMREDKKRLLGKMGVSYAIYGMLIISFQADTLILGTLSDDATLLAIYAMTWKVAEAGRQMLWKIPESMQPYIIEQDARKLQQEMQLQYKKIYTYTFCLSIVAMLAYGLLGKAVIAVWMGDSYVDIPDSRIWLTAVVIFLNGVERTPAIYAYSTLHLRQLNIIAGVEVIVKTILTIVLFKRFGISAPLIAMIATHICGVAYAYWRLGIYVTGFAREDA